MVRSAVRKKLAGAMVRMCSGTISGWSAERLLPWMATKRDAEMTAYCAIGVCVYGPSEQFCGRSVQATGLSCFLCTHHDIVATNRVHIQTDTRLIEKNS